LVVVIRISVDSANYFIFSKLEKLVSGVIRIEPNYQLMG